MRLPLLMEGIFPDGPTTTSRSPHPERRPYRHHPVEQAWFDQLIWDFTTDLDNEWLFHNENRKPDIVISNDNHDPDTMRCFEKLAS